jgi:hypothetical protein
VLAVECATVAARGALAGRRLILRLCRFRLLRRCFGFLRVSSVVVSNRENAPVDEAFSEQAPGEGVVRVVM